MKKKWIITLIAVVLLTAGIVALFTRSNAEFVEEPDKEEVRKAYALLMNSLNTDYLYSDWLNDMGDESRFFATNQKVSEATPAKTAKKSEGTAAVLDYRESTTYRINVPEDGLYTLKLEYTATGNAMSDYTVNIEVNGETLYHEMKTISLPLNWKDETKDYAKDSYGDEIAPGQVRIDGLRAIDLYSNTYCSDEPLLFKLKKGENKIVVTNVSGDGLGLGKLYAKAPEADITYADYLKKYEGIKTENTLIKVNATDYVSKNSMEAIYETGADPVLTPYDVKYKRLNSLKLTEAGTGLDYEVEVEKDGLYSLSFHYTNKKEEFNAFESIYIDGAVPYAELRSYGFKPTGTTWTNETLTDADGKPYLIFLSKGKHLLTLKEEQEPVIEAWRAAKLISEHVSQFALDIKKITGADKDKNRTWKMTRYIPEIPDYLAAYETLINYIRFLTQDNATFGINSALLSDMDKAMLYIEQMAEYPDEIALYLQKMTGRDSSLLVVMSNFTSEILKSNFTLDMIYVTSEGAKLPRATESVFGKMGNGIKKLALSFTENKYSTKTKDDEVLTVWVNRAVTHVDLLQKMIDTEFTPKYGIKVKVSIMPDANKLTMSAAADMTPDVALGLSSYMPFDMACRDALYDMTRFEDFWIVADRFVPGAFVPYLYNEGIYAIPETLDFRALVYRTDIYESLGLTPPDTWEDVVNQLPELQRYGMNFYHNISAGVGYKWFYQTVPLIFQNNGKLYSDDGLSTAIDRTEAVKGMQALGNLFIAYSLDKQVNSFFNSFRYSILPVGLIDSNDYILLKNGAPELEGQWALAAYPGTKQKDGSVSRWYVANGMGGVIFKDTEKADEAWTFLKWWTDRDTQIDYTYTLRSTYGKQFVWIPSNVEALEQSPIERADKDIILDSVKWLRDVPRTPGQYLLERSLSDIWNKMINEGVSAQVVIDEQVIAINREIKKKMTELGYMDEDGNLLKSYVIHDVDWIQEQIENHRVQ